MSLVIDRYRVELDRNHKGEIQRIAPRYKQLLNWSNRTRFKIGATVEFDGKVYAAELHESNSHTIDVQLWRNGRALPEKHMVDVRHAVTTAYCDAFGLKTVIVLGRGTEYRRAPDLIQSGVTL